MKAGDLVKIKAGGAIGMVLTISDHKVFVNGKRAKWVRVFFASEIGKEFGPSDGIYIQSAHQLELVSESR
jgi:hypothetical protein